MQPAPGRGELAVQCPLRDTHGAAVMGDQRADHGLLRLEAGVRRARWRLAEHQLQQAANDVQVGGLGPITDRTLRACRNHRGLLEQRVVLVLQLAQRARDLRGADAKARRETVVRDVDVQHEAAVGGPVDKPTRRRPLIGQEKLSKQPEPALNEDSISCA